MNLPPEIDPGSFRDPSGFIFFKDAEVFRAIAPAYLENFQFFKSSGLAGKLLSSAALLHFHDVTETLPPPHDRYHVIKPLLIPFLSYPYEWCFEQYKAAALLTLQIQKTALHHDMILKDASAYNIQFLKGKPVFIDTLSFEPYHEGSPWIAYRQFCMHFLAPLSLAAYRNESLSRLMQLYIDGIPLELASSLLPRRSYLNSGIASHLHLHARMKKKSGNQKADEKKIRIGKKQLIAICDHLLMTIEGLKLTEKKSYWNEYTCNNSYSRQAIETKEKIISDWTEKQKPVLVWDIGCNTGNYSLIAARHSNLVIAMDADHLSINRFVRSPEYAKSDNILPLVMDLTQPSPGIGWENKERKTPVERGRPDLILALALIHHLRITGGIPVRKIASYLSGLCKHLIIEFVPKSDIQVEEMLMHREDIFSDYTQEQFLSSFLQHFELLEQLPVPDSDRYLFLFKKKDA